ncbi:MAG: hypothetical protein E7329_05075 [Clostridiales bacterium]|nr:hypothetical protein [Clostridiales bacterium]
MNIFLLTDVEGIPGVNDISQMDRTGEGYQIARKMLCESINISVEACFQNGANTVYFLDGHGGGGNVIEELIDPRAIKCSIMEWQQLLKDGKIDYQIELGSHARAGTIGGFLDHTLSSREYFWIKHNGLEMSELSLHAVLCAKYGVPIIATMGDEAACRQAKEYIPGIYTGPVKNAECRNQAETYDNYREIIADTIAAALKHPEKVGMIQYIEPIVVEHAYYRTDMCEKALERWGEKATRIDARTLQKTVMIDTYADLKF